MAIIDASVYIAILNIGETEHQASINWLRRMQRTGEPILAPNILLAEVGAAISRGTHDTLLARRVLHRLQTSTLITLRPVTESLANRSAEIAIDHRIRGCDAIYVALAEQVGHTLVTLDRQQLERGATVIATTSP